MGILVLQTRANIETLGYQVMTAETNVNQRQSEVTQLRANVGATEGKADVLHSTLTVIERERAVIIDDLREIYDLADGESVNLGTVTHTRSSVTLNGGAVDVDHVFRYARALRDSEELANDPRFSSVWISSISNAGRSFNFALAK